MKINSFVPDTKIFTEGLKSKSTEGLDEKNSNVGFGDLLKKELNKVNDKQVEAESSTISFIKGDMDLHQTLVATEEARLSLELAVQVRNKLVNAYEEFNKMQI
ncbi:MAG: flagellar hook-basal body complex protein FliE [Clostridium argentinense]|uniref:Flagellar hook-basal body complex protein FliE n=1 Tax=Clostridium faecium TaxID=2762223 RepID=A0ABR8YQC9_9CLOT|nr:MULTISPECIES: flagellar hook-basal body complex protein FliE [Clostridium]MBD8046429.1 flagellar hook-basal body complex protein FliE [Clostridium faecium]MBS5825251.1 flagellar hook-basal body complex protein FliE [Clostridium argentinense]MDU1348942.1 flagellar hook-basal body complex protein FliE [Clostridium argentinense]